MASVKRKCCCERCNCNTCGVMQMPKAFDVVVQGTGPIGCNRTGAASVRGVGNIDGNYLFTCTAPAGPPGPCIYATPQQSSNQISTVYSDANCITPFQSFSLISGSLNLSTNSGSTFLTIDMRSRDGSATIGPAVAFANITRTGTTCQTFLTPFTVPNATFNGDNASSIGGGTISISPHNPMP